jgi:hypothetical protein
MKKMSYFAVLVGIVLSVMVVSAQAPPPIMPLMSVTRILVKPDRVAEFREVEKLYSEAYKKGGGPWRRFYQARAGNVFEYVVLSPISTYAYLDGDSYITKGSSEADRARWGARRSQCTESAVTTYERLVPDAFINMPGASQPALLIENRYRVKQGMGADFASFVKAETIPLLKKAGVGLYVLRSVEFGGSRNQYVSRRGATKFEELDVNLVQKTLGQAAATQYFAKSAALLTDVEIRVYAYQADMSYAGVQ